MTTPHTPPSPSPSPPKSTEVETSSTEIETYNFTSDLEQLMSLIINTFYSDKSIFLRELISNSSDAIGKIRHESLLNPSVLRDGEQFNIEIIPDIDNKTLTIKDNGIGMTKEDLINNLGTIARSGTKEFVEKIQKSGDLSLVGQFGCGFYSSFLVADKVRVISKHNDSDHSYEWSSDASGSYTIKELPDTKPTPDDRGTEIILHIKDEQSQFLKSDIIGSVIKTHSRYTNYPILLLVEKQEEEEVTDNEGSKDDEDDNVKIEDSEDDKPSKDDDEPKIEEVKEKKTKKIKKIVKKLQHINDSIPIWKKPVSENTEEDYKNFL